MKFWKVDSPTCGRLNSEQIRWYRGNWYLSKWYTLLFTSIYCPDRDWFPTGEFSSHLPQQERKDAIKSNRRCFYYSTICQVTFFPFIIFNTPTGRKRFSTKLRPPHCANSSSAYICRIHLLVESSGLSPS